MKNTARVLHSIAREHIPADVDLLPAILAQIEKEYRPKMKTRTKLIVAFAVFILIAAVTFISIPGAVNAMLRLFGYIPGVGIVDQGSLLRVLAEPVTVTREGISVSVTSAILADNRTHIEYRIFGVPGSAYPDGEDVLGCMQVPYLRLLDGSQLAMTGNDYPPIPANVNEAVFVMPCILHTLPGKVPTDWELPLRFKPAPPDLTVMPVIDIATPEPSTPTPGAMDQPGPMPSATIQPAITENAVKFIKEIETSDGYILVVQLPSHDLPGSQIHLNEAAEIRDANGKRVVYSYPSDLDPNQLGLDPSQAYWYAQFKAAGLAYPLTISFSGNTLQQAEPGATAEFTFDAGSNPKAGQEWTPNQDIQIAGHTLRLHVIRVDSRNGYSFSFLSDPDLVSLNLEILGYTARGSGWGGDAASGSFEKSLSYVNIPTGQLTVRITNLVVTGESFTWTGQWSPANPRTDLPANPTPQPSLCLTVAGLANLAKAPESLSTGKALVYEQLEGSDQWGLVLYSLDGSQKQVVAADAGWGALSPDGNQVAYTPFSTEEVDIHVVDLQDQSVHTLPGASGFDYHWSPDGSQIAYVALGGDVIDSVFVVNADGTRNRRVSDLSYELVVGWSPDGSLLYYAAPYTGNAAWKVYVFDLASSQTKELFTIENGTPKALNPRLSPDGQWIVYRGKDNSNLYLVRIDGSDTHQVFESIGAMGSEWTLSGWLGVSLMEQDSYKQQLLLVNPLSCEAYMLMEIGGDLEGFYLP